MTSLKSLSPRTTQTIADEVFQATFGEEDGFEEEGRRPKEVW